MKIAKTVIVEDDDDIAVEEIVVNGEQIMGNEEFFDPAALCSVQITGVSDGEKGQGILDYFQKLFSENYSVFKANCP